MPTDQRPNIIWIIDDQHRAQATGYKGDPNLSTPNLDRLAQEGINFSAAVSGFPLCCPYRGSMLTGRYPHHCVPGHEYQLPPEQPTIAQPLRQAGYRTAYFGKWHVDGFKESRDRAAMHIVPPQRRGGFERWVGYENNNSPWDSWVHGGQNENAFHYRLPGYETDALTDLLLAYLEEQTNLRQDGSHQPFFAVLSVQPPHNPYDAPNRWRERHTPGNIHLRRNVPEIDRVQERARRDLAGYYAQIENIDWNVGRVMRRLSELALRDETHLFFFSDHGDMHGSHGQFHKTAPWEESIRVPFLLGGGPPYYTYRSGSNSAPVNHVDIAPTTLGLCGIPIPDWMEGTDYSAVRLGGAVANEPDSAFLQVVIPTGHGDSVDRPWRGVVTRDGWKYIALQEQPWLMFNLNEDPYEQANLAMNSRYATERQRLNRRLAAWINDTGDEFRLPDL